MAGEWITKTNWEALNKRWVEMQERIATLERELEENKRLQTHSNRLQASLQENTRLRGILENLTRDKVRNKPDTSPNQEGYWDINGSYDGETSFKYCECGMELGHAGQCFAGE